MQTREYRNQKSREYRQALKQKLLNAYGRKCACCGQAGDQFLTIDHIYNDAHIDRKLGKYQSSGLATWIWLQRNGFPKGNIQTLCWNCNCGKKSNGGVCPHLNDLTP